MQNIDIIVLDILGAWCIFICWKIFLRRSIKGFLLIGLSILFLILAFPFKNIMRTILFITSEIFFWVGVILIGTIEVNKIKELGKVASIANILLGKITKVTKKEEKTTLPLLSEKILYIISCTLLIIYSLIDYFIFGGDLNNDLPMFFIGVIIIIYSLISRTNKKE